MKRLLGLLSLSITLFLTSCQVVTISTENYRVDFIDTVDSSVIQSTRVLAGKKVQPVEDPVKKDYRFDGWTDDCKNRFDFDNFIVNSNTKIYAGWIELDRVPSISGSFVSEDGHSTLYIVKEKNTPAEIEWDESVVLYENDSKAAVYYTLDGTDPLTSETRKLYASQFSCDDLKLEGEKQVQIRAYAEKEGCKNSYEYNLSVKLKKYTVTLDKNTGADDDVSTEYVYSGLKLTEPEVPVYEDHVFLGWYVSSTDVYDFNQTVAHTENFTLTAMWKEYGKLSPLTVKSVSDKQTLNIAGDSTAYYEYLDVIRLACNSAEDDEGSEVFYTLDGSDPKTNGIKYTGEDISLTFDDKTKPVQLKAYAKKSLMKDSDVFSVNFYYKAYTVVIDSTVPGAAESMVTKKVYSGEKIEEPASLSNDDYKFLGWYVESVAYDFDKVVAYTSDFIIKAKWQEKGVLAKVNAEYEGANFQVDKNAVVKLSKDENAEGTEFGIIVYTLDGSDPVVQNDPNYVSGAMVYNVLNPITIDADTVVKAAVFSTKLTSYKHSEITEMPFKLKEYSVSFYGADVEAQTVVSGQKAQVPVEPVSDEKNFEGWFDSDGNLFDFNTEIYSNVVLTAKWTQKPSLKKVTVSYEGSDYKVDKGQSVTLSIDTASAGADKAELWFTTDGTNPLISTTKTVAAGDSESIVIDEETQIRAVAASTDSYYLSSEEVSVVFTLKTYSVQFDMNGSTSMAPASQLVASGSCAVRPVSVSAYAGHVFKGWYVDSSASALYDFDTAVTSNVRLYAGWEIAEVQKPAAIENLQVTGNDRIHATWSNPEEYSSIVVTVSNSEDTVVKTAVLSGSAEEFIYTDAPALGNYTVSIVAVGPTGLESDSAAAVVKYYHNTLGTLHLAEGDENPPSFITLFPERILISERNLSEETNVWLPIVTNIDSVKKGARAQSNNSYVEWYTSNNGTDWKQASTENTSSFEWEYSNNGILMMRFKPKSLNKGLTYYSLKVYSLGGSYVVSNTCAVEYATSRANLMGYYYYSDNTYSKDYNAEKTVVGFVCDVDKNNKPCRIVAAEDSSSGSKWAPGATNGYTRQYLTTIDDGAMNWKVVSMVDTNGVENASVNYPAFDSCNKFEAGGLDWYLPGSGELIQICASKGTFNSLSNGFTKFSAAQYWTSSDIGANKALMFNFSDCYTNGNQKDTNNCVRPIAKVSPAGGEEIGGGEDTVKTVVLTAEIDTGSGYSVYFTGTFNESENWSKAVEGAWHSGNKWTATVTYTGESFKWKTIKAKSDSGVCETDSLVNAKWESGENRTAPDTVTGTPSY